MSSFKVHDGFLRTFLIVAAITLLFLGTTLYCAHHAPQTKPVPNICDKALVNPDGAHLNVPLLLQGSDCGWCWAADIAMLGTYYSKKSINLCDIVTHTTTVTVTASTGVIAKRLDCCAPNACATPCNHGGSDAQIREGFRLVGYPHTRLESTISEDHLKIELSSNRPVMLEVRSVDPTLLPNGTLEYPRHVRIVSGFTPPKSPDGDAIYEVLDSNTPAPLTRTYHELIFEPKDMALAHKPNFWEQTWVLTSTAVPDCKR